MKNKNFISFLINILIGILFSFPVFSAQGSTDCYININIEFTVSEIQSEPVAVQKIDQSPYLFHSNIHLYDALPAKHFKSNLTTGSKQSHLSDFHPPHPVDNFRKYYLSDSFFTNPYYVDLSYLKELRTTKMLC